MTRSYDGLPDPPVAAEVTMGNNDYFPLYFRRLRKSKWWRRASDLARSRNVDMWGEAYEQQPAGSLPDEDSDLAEAAGYGRDVKAFTGAKTEIMEPWILCNDGRWYHPTVCEVVLFLWEKGSVIRRDAAKRQRERRERLKAAKTAAPVTQNGPTVTRDTPSPSRVTGVLERDASRVTPPLVTRTVTAKERRGDIGANAPVAFAPQSATENAPWKADLEFKALWGAATAEMRRRAKSMAKVWPDWVKARRSTAGKTILRGMLGYLDGDPDVRRTGGPGLHIWLRDRTWESWVGSGGDMGADWSEERWAIAVDIWRRERRWDEGLGPEPGAPGCRVPPALLITTTQRSEVA